MAMPNTSVDEYNLFMFWKDDVGIAGKIFAVQAKTITHLVQEGANDFFGFCVLALGFGHDLAALFFCKDVHSLKSLFKFEKQLNNVGHSGGQQWWYGVSDLFGDFDF